MNTYKERFPTRPTTLIIEGRLTDRDKINRFEIRLDYYNEDELNFFYELLSSAFQKTYEMRNQRVIKEQDEREYKEYIRLKAKYENGKA